MAAESKSVNVLREFTKLPETKTDTMTILVIIDIVLLT